MKEHLKELFEYNNHYNQKIIGLLVKNESILSEKCIKIINHLINAHQIWNARIMNKLQFDVWQINNSADLYKIDNENYIASLKILDDFNLDSEIQYINSNGSKFLNKIKDILYHIINHATYHRGQIALELKQIGLEPLNTDYIFYKRESIR